MTSHTPTREKGTTEAVLRFPVHDTNLVFELVKIHPSVFRNRDGRSGFDPRQEQ